MTQDDTHTTSDAHTGRVPAVLSLSSAQGQRPRQEDAGSVLTFEGSRSGPFSLLVVADGVGGQAKGDEASTLAANAVVQEMLTRLQEPDADVFHALVEATQAAHMVVRSIGEGEFQGPASTLLAAVLIDQTVYLAWLGDSIAIHLRDGKAEILTQPHTDEAGRLTRYIGHPDLPTCTVDTIHLEPGDALMLMSDGVSGVLGLDDFVRLASDASAHSLAKHLVDEALFFGSTDNCTAATLTLPGDPVGTDIEIDPDLDEAAADTSETNRIRRFIVEATLRELEPETAAC